MKTIRKQKKNKGFSLVEVLLAVVILGLVATPILQLFYSSYEMSMKSKKSLAAADLSQTVLEYISGMSMDDYTSSSDSSLQKRGLKKYYIDSTNPSLVPGGPIGAVGKSASCSSFPSEACTVTYSNISCGGFKYIVVINFDKPDDASDDYFTYNVRVDIKGSDGTYYNSAQTKVVNKY